MEPRRPTTMVRRTQTLAMAALLAAAAVAVFCPARALAKSRPHHAHEDLFDEDDLLLGFKAGPQLTGFTDYTASNGAVVGVTSSTRFMVGAVAKFVYPLPRFEVGLMWNARGWVNTPDTVHFFAIPVAMKFPVEIDRDVDFEMGLGAEPEFTMFGADPHKNFMMGVFPTVGLSVDFRSFVFDFDLRYNVGLDSVSTFFPGAHNRDLQMLAGLLWHF